MTRPYIVGQLIVAYLTRARATRPVKRIISYMFRYHKVNPPATRAHLGRLVKDGAITRVAPGVYQAMQ